MFEHSVGKQLSLVMSAVCTRADLCSCTPAILITFRMHRPASCSIDASADEGKVTLARDVATCEYMLTAVTTASPEDSGFDGDVYVKLLVSKHAVGLHAAALSHPIPVYVAIKETLRAARRPHTSNLLKLWSWLTSNA
jgi:hypothetical protein